MGGVTDSLFGGGDEQTSSQANGFAALPADVQEEFLNAIRYGSDLALGNPSQYFAPMGLTAEEQRARSMINPDNIGASIQNYLNPYSDYAIRAINDQYESPQSALQAQAAEAGAFGSSRYRNTAADLVQARLNAIGQNMGAQYNTAFNQMNAGIGQLLGFGGLERGIDLQQRQAPIAASSYAAGLYQPLLNTGTSTQVRSGGGSGILGGLGSLGGFLQGGDQSGLFDVFSGDSSDYLDFGIDAAAAYFGVPSPNTFRGGGSGGSTLFPGNVGGGTYF